MSEVTLDSFKKTLDALIDANPHARNKGDSFKTWIKEHFGYEARISHIKEQRQTTNRVSEQFRYFSPIVVFVCIPEVKRDTLMAYILDRVYKELENVAVIGVKDSDGVRTYTFEQLVVFKTSTFTDWAKAFFEKVENATDLGERMGHPLTLPSQTGLAAPTTDGSITSKKKNCLEVVRKPRINPIHPLNFIIYGAPGTGKTYSTAEYALAIIENRPVDTRRKSYEERKAVMTAYKDYVRKGQIVFTTFHQSYGYEEFIQGLRPDTKSDKMAFNTVDGVFKRIADDALDQEKNFVIIIDEINRANISKVFGELITLIESDKRWGEVNETCATLQSGDIFAVPNNLYIVGTMNSADKSISLIDAALRRRFEFVEQYPDDSLIDDPTLKDVLIKINAILADSLESSDLLIGHSYFMGKTADDLCTILNNSIIPLLYEYFYDNKKKVMSVLKETLKELKNVDVKDNKISRVYVKWVSKPQEQKD